MPVRHTTPLLTILTSMDMKVALLHSYLYDNGYFSGGKTVIGRVGSTQMVEIWGRLDLDCLREETRSAEVN